MALALQEKKQYPLRGGLITGEPEETLNSNYSPYLRNVRIVKNVTTRKGPSFYSVPVGQTIDGVVSGVTVSGLEGTATTKLAAPFTAVSGNYLSAVELQLKLGSNAPTSDIITEIWSGDTQPQTKLATTSISPGLLTATYGYVRTYIHLPPKLTNGTKYWVVAYVQSGGLGSFFWATTNNDTALTTTSMTWVAATGSLTLKSYSAPNSPVLGFKRVNFANGTNVSVFATKEGVWRVNDLDGSVTQIFSTSNTATQYIFLFYNDILYWVNGVDVPQKWNGTTQAALGGSPPVSSYIAEHKNQIMLVSATDRTRIIYSAIGQPEVYDAVNFFYVPFPGSSDYVRTLKSALGGLIIATRKTRYRLLGNDINDYALTPSIGSEGVVNARCSVLYGNYEYFVSDNGIGVFNGSTSTILSTLIQPEFDAVGDKAAMSLDAQGGYLRAYYPGTGAITNTECFVYDLVRKQWLLDTQTYVRTSGAFDGPGDKSQLIQGSSIVGAIYYAETANNDLGDAIAMKYWTKYESFGEPNDQHRIKRFYPEFVGQTGTYSCSIYADQDYANSPQLIQEQSVSKQGARLGIDFRLGVSRLGSFGMIKPRLQVSGYADRVQYRFEHSGVNQPIELIGYTSYYQAKRPR